MSVSPSCFQLHAAFRNNMRYVFRLVWSSYNCRWKADAIKTNVKTEFRRLPRHSLHSAFTKQPTEEEHRHSTTNMFLDRCD